MMRHRARGSSLIGLAAAVAIWAEVAGAQPAASARQSFLRLVDRARVPLAPEVAPLGGASALVREHFSFATEQSARVPGLSVKRPGPGRRPAVIVLHGTGDNKQGMVPLLDQLADRGFVAVAIDGRHHGERAKGPGDYPQAILQAYRTGRGHPFLYDTAWDAMRLIDYLETRPDVDPARIGMIGISKGGMETYLTAAADPRVAAAVPVIGVQSFRWALEHDRWQARVETIFGAVMGAARDGLRPVDGEFVQEFYDRVVPGIYEEFDAPAMLPLIAPRPLLVINGDSDELTPLEGVREAAAAAERAYREAAADDKFRLLVQANAGHEFTPAAQRAAFDWFVRWLKP